MNYWLFDTAVLVQIAEQDRGKLEQAKTTVEGVVEGLPWPGSR
jgi:hypothetical protein